MDGTEHIQERIKNKYIKLSPYAELGSPMIREMRNFCEDLKDEFVLLIDAMENQNKKIARQEKIINSIREILWRKEEEQIEKTKQQIKRRGVSL